MRENPDAMSERMEPEVDWRRRLVAGGAVVVGIVVLGLIASATVPRWWAQRVGDQVGGSITQGVLVGLFYGFLFTLLPLVVLGVVLRWLRTRRALAAATLVALVLALPNLMTLGIVLGRGGGAHAGDRILDVEAPAFRGASLAGAIAAFLLVAYLAYLLTSRKRAREDARRTRARSTGPAGRTESDTRET